MNTRAGTAVDAVCIHVLRPRVSRCACWYMRRLHSEWLIIRTTTACRKHQSYLMERWLDFTEVFSLPVLSKLPWNRKSKDEMEIKETFESMWTLLRRAVLYFMRYEDCQHSEDAILSAQRTLLDYGAMAEEVCSTPLPTSFTR